VKVGEQNKGQLLRRTEAPYVIYDNHKFCAGEIVKVIYEESGGYTKVSRANGKVDFIVYSPEEWEFVEKEND
jgi:hypothetical protein